MLFPEKSLTYTLTFFGCSLPFLSRELPKMSLEIQPSRFLLLNSILKTSLLLTLPTTRGGTIGLATEMVLNTFGLDLESIRRIPVYE